jgi:hypothetical protein
VWDPLNSEGFRKLSYNVSDEKVTELMVPVYRDIPRDTPLIAAHVWPAQAAVHAGMTHVVNAVPDNWPMALHLAEGAIHTVQTPSAYLGYRTLRGMRKGEVLSPMPGRRCTRPATMWTTSWFRTSTPTAPGGRRASPPAARSAIC